MFKGLRVASPTRALVVPQWLVLSWVHRRSRVRTLSSLFAKYFVGGGYFCQVAGAGPACQHGGAGPICQVAGAGPACQHGGAGPICQVGGGISGQWWVPHVIW
jgi:hypothetical protein